MQYRTLESSGLNVSVLSFGGMSLGIDHAANARLLHRAKDLGINFFDTADLYDKGLNEITFGKAFRDCRQEVLIATKVGNQWRPDGAGWDWNPRKEYILKAVDESLRRLQTDYIDLYQLHGGTIDDPIDETIEAFEYLQQVGKIRYYGISSIRPNVIRAYVEKSNIVSVMMQYSLLDRRPEEEVLELLRENTVGVIVRGALAKGLLAGKPSREYLDYTEQELAQVQQKLSQWDSSTQRPLDLAIKYALIPASVTTLALGIRTLSQLEANVKALDSPPLSLAETHQLQALTKSSRYLKHR